MNFEKTLAISIVCSVVGLILSLYVLFTALNQVDWDAEIVEAGKAIKNISHEIQEYQPE